MMTAAAADDDDDVDVEGKEKVKRTNYLSVLYRRPKVLLFSSFERRIPIDREADVENNLCRFSI